MVIANGTLGLEQAGAKGDQALSEGIAVEWRW
jgi:hypothetical protein